MKINVLIVEDDPITAMDIQEILEKSGMRVIDTVASGESAINLVKHKTPDVIVFDIKLEGEKDGIETAKIINQNGYFPIIYLTAYTERPFADKALSTNPAAFLSKPFDEKDLIYAVEIAFKNHIDRIFDGVAEREVRQTIFLKSSDRYDKVNLREILFFKAEGSYSKVQTTDRTYSLSSNLNTVSKKLNHPQFLRVHRSYLVNIVNIDSFDSDYLYLGTFHIPYSKAHKDQVAEVLKKIS